MNLILETKTKSDEIIKAYLEENASQALADKINNGVTVEKDGKRLLNKKSLSSFNKYANEEARKIAEKGANGIYVDDDTVFGWAIHYFEEDGIIGTLYNEDGTEYKPSKPSKAPQAQTPATSTVVNKKEPQISLFDMMNGNDHNTELSDVDSEDCEEEPTDEEIEEAFEVEPAQKTQTKISPFYEKYRELALKYPDSVICYRLGDFYEILGKKAVTVANALELTLTGRDCGLSERVPMVGFPYHCVDNYVSKLIRNGFKVALVEQTGEITEKPSNKPAIDTETGEIFSDEITEEETLSNYHKGALLTLLELFGDDATIG